MARRLVASLLAAAAVLAGCGTLRAPATPGVVKVTLQSRQSQPLDDSITLRRDHRATG